MGSRQSERSIFRNVGNILAECETMRIELVKEVTLVWGASYEKALRDCTDIPNLAGDTEEPNENEPWAGEGPQQDSSH